MSLLLHLETSTKACSVALSEEGKLLTIREELNEDFMHSEKLTLFIMDVMESAGRQLSELSGVSVASGPGSYTGLRIGVSTAKGLCYALEIPLLAVDALISLAVLASEKHPGKKLCALIDARRMEVYNACYNEQLESLKPISADIIDEHAYKEFEPFVYFGDGAQKLETIWAGRNCMIDREIYSSAAGQVTLAYQKFLKCEFEDVAYFEPYYLKDFVTK